ncbi:beta-glucosidase [Rhizobiales bacterium GAS188]|nr:beta-glucosidase [Rhizobiales bacterium GAS188]
MLRSGELALIERLVAEMTLEEKLGQLTMVSAELIQTGPTSAPITPKLIREGRIGSLLNLWGAERVREVQRLAVEESRLKIPLFFGLDVVHGLKTIFPIPLGESCAFDPGLWERTARAAAEETAAAGVDLTFAPMLDVARDPRWGRTVEGPGEDTFVASRFAEAKVRGFQSPHLGDARAVAATAKHLAAYGAVQAGREYASVDISQRQLHEIYLPPFRAAVEAGVAAIMPAFTDLDGTPMTANAAILRDLVRGQWGFSGVMISDYGSVAELIPHGVAADLADAAALALTAGVDIDMMGGGAYSEGLPRALERGKVTLDAIDAAVRRVLELKARLGLFEDPYRRCGTGRPPEVGDADAKRRDLAREAGRRSIVLLKNRNGVLPLRDHSGSVAVIGPLADASGALQDQGKAAGTAGKAIAVLDGLRDALPDAAISFTPGCGVDRIEDSAKAKALDLARRNDVVVLCLGETPAMSGEAASRARPGLPEAQCELARAVIALEKPVVVLLFSGRPLVLPDWLAERAEALLAVWFPGSETAGVVGDVLSGRFNPTGRLCMTWPIDVGQIPIFFGERPTGRPAIADVHYSSKYLDMPNEPLFGFGHGLSYSQFDLSGLRADRAEMRAGDSIHVEVDVANSSAVAGEETIFLFVHDPVASVARPLLELKGFGKIALAAGDQGTVRFRLAAEDLRFVGPDLASRLEPGAFDLYVGRSAAREGLLSTRIELLA